jgi:hypothetical protein
MNVEACGSVSLMHYLTTYRFQALLVILSVVLAAGFPAMDETIVGDVANNEGNLPHETLLDIGN